MSAQPGIIYETFKVPTDLEADFDVWYRAERIPRMLEEPGILAAAQWRFRQTAPIHGLPLEPVALGQYITYFDVADVADVRRRGGWRLDAVGLSQPGLALVRRLDGLRCNLYQQIFVSGDPLPFPSDARALLVVHLEAPPEIDEEFNAWYNTEHMPPLLRAAGFLRIRRFKALEGEPTYVTLYDTTSWDDYARMPERREVINTPWMRRIFGRVRHSVTWYDRCAELSILSPDGPNAPSDRVLARP
jgi:hypothetical protein